MAIEFKRRDFTVAEYHRMAEVGILGPDERVELLDGQLVEMSPIGVPHWVVHARIVQYLVEEFGERALVVGQGSFPLGAKNEPQPDIAILPPEIGHRIRGTPEPKDIHAIIELADSSISKDAGPKLRLYARFAIPDYVIVDLRGNFVLHHTAPHELGYKSVAELRSGAFRLHAFADVPLEAGRFLVPN